VWEDSSQIFIINTDGSNLVQLSVNPKMLCFHLSLSPDGKWIAAECRPNVTVMRPSEYEAGLKSNIYLFDADKPGAKPRKLSKCDPSRSSSLFYACGARNPSFKPSM
jgi:Tol biopolymer transport system component